MRRIVTILVTVLVCSVLAGEANAAIGWAGNVWPVNENTYPEGTDIGVYVQFWKEGVTDIAGQGPGISAALYYGPNGGPFQSVPMVFNTDVGNNDEYTASIPAAAFDGIAEIYFYCEGYDSTDASTYTGIKDQNSNDPPFKLYITPVLNQAVTVYFRLCLPPEGDPEHDPAPGDVCVVGDAAELTSWGSGVMMINLCPVPSPQFYELGIVFPAGSNPAIQYKYRKNDCADWESVGNRSVFIDDSSPMFIIPWVDHWNNFTGDDCPLCGVGSDDTSWGEIKQLHK